MHRLNILNNTLKNLLKEKFSIAILKIFGWRLLDSFNRLTHSALWKKGLLLFVLQQLFFDNWKQLLILISIIVNIYDLG